MADLVSHVDNIPRDVKISLETPCISIKIYKCPQRPSDQLIQRMLEKAYEAAFYDDDGYIDCANPDGETAIKWTRDFWNGDREVVSIISTPSVNLEKTCINHNDIVVNYMTYFYKDEIQKRLVPPQIPKPQPLWPDWI